MPSPNSLQSRLAIYATALGFLLIIGQGLTGSLTSKAITKAMDATNLWGWYQVKTVQEGPLTNLLTQAGIVRENAPTVERRALRMVAAEADKAQQRLTFRVGIAQTGSTLIAMAAILATLMIAVPHPALMTMSVGFATSGAASYFCAAFTAEMGEAIAMFGRAYANLATDIGRFVDLLS
jgi:hypothetical protein